MIINIIMNINNIVITTGMSVLFSVYSLYNILEYLRTLNNYRVKQINNLQNMVNDTNKNYNNLFKQYIELQQKYDDLSISHVYINKELILLNLRLIELEGNKNSEININNNIVSLPEPPSIVCDELCYFNSDVPRIHMETMNTINDINIDVEFVESLNLEYKFDNTEDTSVCNSEKKSRSRSTSLTEINWIGLTKKMFFG